MDPGIRISIKSYGTRTMALTLTIQDHLFVFVFDFNDGSHLNKKTFHTHWYETVDHFRAGLGQLLSLAHSSQVCSNVVFAPESVLLSLQLMQCP
jgi:hypothetical protein